MRSAVQSPLSNPNDRFRCSRHGHHAIAEAGSLERHIVAISQNTRVVAKARDGRGVGLHRAEVFDPPPSFNCHAPKLVPFEAGAVNVILSSTD